MVNSVVSVLTIAGVLVAVGVALWDCRGDVRAWHLGALVAGIAILALAASAMLGSGLIIMALAVGSMAVLLACALVTSTLALLLRRAFPPKAALDVHRAHAVRHGDVDHSRTYAVPQMASLLVAGMLVKSGLHAVALPVAAFFAALSWVAAARRLRLIRNTPTSRIASAAQGLVELSGYGRPIGERLVASPLRRQPCIWFRYRIEEKQGKNWRTVEVATSDEPFVLDDGSGTTLVEPARAVVKTPNKHVWSEGKRRYTEEWLYPKARLHVLGEFASEHPAARELDARKDASDLLAGWKRDPAELKKRFDADGDGEVSLAEWQVARNQAAQQVAAAHAEVRDLPATNVVRAPGNGPYLISSGTETDVTSQARRSALLRLSWFGLLLGGSTYAVLTSAGSSRRLPRRAVQPRQ